MGELGGAFVTYTDRTTGDVIASSGHYQYDGTAILFSPLVYTQSCSNRYIGLDDILG